MFGRKQPELLEVSWENDPRLRSFDYGPAGPQTVITPHLPMMSYATAIVTAMNGIGPISFTYPPVISWLDQNGDDDDE